MCYGRGGNEPTATDAHLLLGRIPLVLLGGEVPLDAAAAHTGMAELAASLGLGVERCADGVLEISAWNQANAIRKVTVKRGIDVRDFALIAFGGSGPLLACRLIDVLGLRAAIVPRDPGNLSAFGLLTSDVRSDHVRTLVRRVADLDEATLAGIFGELEGAAASTLGRQGFARDHGAFARSADLRYVGQAFEVRVGAPPGDVDESFSAAVVERFHDEHERLFGYCYRHDPSHAVEWVNLRVTGIGPIRSPRLVPLSAGHDDPARARVGERPVRFGESWHDASIYARDALRAGDALPGPAVVEEFGSTLPIAPGFTAHVDGLGHIVVARLGSE